MVTFLVFAVIAVILVLVILAATFFINISTNDYEKHSAYECGFEPFGDARSFFDIHFYVIGLLFIIFDLEIVFLIPFVVDIANISAVGYANLLIFLAVILVGFYYEWALGLLNWVPKKVQRPERTLNSSPLLALVAPSLAFHIDSVFLSFWALIVGCLIMNYASNLIYKVINLAALSLFIAGMWSYFSDLTFLYIVYILAFIGAVVMLFLSIVLMLPASTTARASVQNSALPISAIIVEVVESSWGNRSVLDLLAAGVFITVFFLALGLLRFLCGAFGDIFDFVSSRPQPERSLSALSKLACSWISGIIWAPSSVLLAYTKNPVNMSELPLQGMLALHWHDLLYFLYLNIETHLYSGKNARMYLHTSPVWGRVFMIFEYPVAPARTPRRVNDLLPDVKSAYTPFQPVFSLFRLLPYKVCVPFIPYLKSNRLVSLWSNRALFLLNTLWFLLVTASLNIGIYVKDAHVSTGFVKQAIMLASIFAVAVPCYPMKANLLAVTSLSDSSCANPQENLAAIKHILYEENMLLLLLPAVGLLVALIGSAVFTRASHKNNI